MRLQGAGSHLRGGSVSKPFGTTAAEVPARQPSPGRAAGFPVAPQAEHDAAMPAAQHPAAISGDRKPWQGPGQPEQGPKWPDGQGGRPQQSPNTNHQVGTRPLGVSRVACPGCLTCSPVWDSAGSPPLNSEPRQVAGDPMGPQLAEAQQGKGTGEWWEGGVEARWSWRWRWRWKGR